MSFTERHTYATLPRTARGVPLVLNGDPKGKNFLYCNGNNVIIRDIENPAIVDIYSEHSQPPVVAKYSPSGFYIASGDRGGNLRIWDATQKQHLLKCEYRPISQEIQDISWSEDSKRIAVGGNGREKFGHVIMFDTGTSVGEIMGHSKPINAIDFKPNRPYRIATAGEDRCVCFFQGPPFKFSNSHTDHAGFVNCLRYAPSGEVFISGGADGNAFIYNGKEGDKIGQLGEPAHKGGIYALSFSPDSRELLTVSGDKTCKIWDIQTMQCVQEFVMGTRIEDMQVGCLWQNQYLLSVAVSGNISYLDRQNPSSPLRIIKGHNRPITALALSEDRQRAYTGASEGGLRCWNVQTGECEEFKGKGHSNQIEDMVVMDNIIVTAALDDMLMFTEEGSDTEGQQVKMDSQPRGLAAAPGGLVVVACLEEIVVMRGTHIVSSLKVSYEPECVAIHPGQTEVAVGAGKRSCTKLFIYNLSGDALQEKRVLENEGGNITDLKYSPDGAYLAVCDENKKTKVLELPQYERYISDDYFSYHAARVTTLDWTPDGTHLGTGSIDSSVMRFGLDKSRSMIKGACPLSHPTKVRWIDNHTIVASTHDSNLRFWTFQDN